MKQCPKGHIYDEKRSASCPYCGGFGAEPAFPKTTPLTPQASDAFPPTMPLDSEPQEKKSDKMSVTVALSETKSGRKPVMGWLVAIDGEELGTSYIIHGEQNSIGRGDSFDVNLRGNEAVSSEGNAVISFDAQNRKFYLTPIFGKGKNNVYHNDSLLLAPTEITDYARIKLGTVTYVFRSFCNEQFTYEYEKS